MGYKTVKCRQCGKTYPNMYDKCKHCGAINIESENVKTSLENFAKQFMAGTTDTITTGLESQKQDINYLLTTFPDVIKETERTKKKLIVSIEEFRNNAIEKIKKLKKENEKLRNQISNLQNEDIPKFAIAIFNQMSQSQAQSQTQTIDIHFFKELMETIKIIKQEYESGLYDEFPSEIKEDIKTIFIERDDLSKDDLNSIKNYKKSKLYSFLTSDKVLMASDALIKLISLIDKIP
jgi:hypothetical protein